ncbi:MAG: SDH family Clp fold serine proteinase [Bacteroidota bacterium]
MSNWSEVLTEIGEYQKNATQSLDLVRRKYLKALHEHTKRNVIAYYSGWLQKPNQLDTTINDKDKNALMVTIHKLDRKKGLDLILHTPGGDLAATESIVDYIKSMFGKDIRAIIPQISMSAGTMIALSCKSIMMGKQSNLGPIDPQMGGVACQAVIDEFNKAVKDIKSNPASAPLWQVIIAKYNPTFLGACQHAITWSEKMVHAWLEDNMCSGDAGKAEKILKEISDHNTNKSHSRHISKEKCEAIGLTIESLEKDQQLQDLILTIHHSFMHSFTQSSALKVVENHLGIAYVEHHPMSIKLQTVPQAQESNGHGPKIEAEEWEAQSSQEKRQKAKLPS